MRPHPRPPRCRRARRRGLESHAGVAGDYTRAVRAAVDSVQEMVPALLFLCAGVPLAALLDRLGFFDALASRIEARFAELPVAVLWWLAAATTAVLNLDTTIVLLTPLYVRLARRAGVDPLRLALVPLLLAAFASSVLPVSNLTTLIAAERFDLATGDVLARLGPVSLVACVVGWLAYRGRHPATIAGGVPAQVDRRALTVGGLVVVGLLAGFVVGPARGVEAWAVVLAADLVLVVVTRHVPWREVPVATALGVAAVGGLVGLVVPDEALRSVLDADQPLAVGGLVLAGAGAANALNNLPALLAATASATDMTPGMWAWLAGTNTGSVLLPLGALANILWWRIIRDEGLALDLRGYVRAVAPVAAPALLAAALTLAVLG